MISQSDIRQIIICANITSGLYYYLYSCEHGRPLQYTSAGYNTLARRLSYAFHKLYYFFRVPKYVIRRDTHRF